MFPIYLFLYILVSLVIAESTYNLIAEFGAYNQPIGVYFPGDIIEEHDIFGYTLPEHFLQVIDPNSFGLEAVNFDSTLLLRSADLKIRVLIEFRQVAPDDESAGEYRYQLTFHNLAWGDRDGDAPLELQYSQDGFMWIDGGHSVSHYTDEGHEFIIRNSEQVAIFSVLVSPFVESANDENGANNGDWKE